MSKKEENEQKYFTQSELLEQGWTKGLIVKFFSEPDARRTNPQYRSAAPVKLYSIEKVNAVIQTEEYKLARAKVEKRKLAAKKAADSKRENSLKECENALERIKIERIPLDRLRSLVLNDKQAWYDFNGIERYAHDADEDTVRRWMVNYIRHNMTNYDYCLSVWKGSVGIKETYLSFHSRILDKIARIYPELREECEEQKLNTKTSEFFKSLQDT